MHMQRMEPKGRPNLDPKRYTSNNTSQIPNDLQKNQLELTNNNQD